MTIQSNMDTSVWVKMLLVFTTIKNAATSTQCPSDWIERKHSCYYFSEDKKTFTSAWEKCRQDGAYMVKVTDDDTSQFLYQRKEHLTGSWLGLLKRDYMWSDGSNVRWFPNELPLNATGNAHCVYFEGNVGTWGTRQCTVYLQYICEKDSETAECDWSWKYHKGKCYLISAADKSTFGGMWKQCKMFGARPAKIEHKETLIFLTQNSDFAHGHWFWIGMSTLQWDDGSVYDWYKDLGPRQHHECVKLSGADGTWQYVDCNEEHFYICEKNSTDDLNEKSPSEPSIPRTLKSESTFTTTTSTVFMQDQESNFKTTLIIAIVYPIVLVVLIFFVWKMCRSKGRNCMAAKCCAPLYDDVVVPGTYERLPPFYINVQH